jgi:phenylalanyl-tRNA synthetase alpha chain
MTSSPPVSLEQDLTTLQSRAIAEITAADSLEALDQLRVGYLGKKGQVSKILGGMGKLPPEERPRIGALANTVKTAVQSAIEDRKAALQTAQINAQLAAETLDVTMPGVYRPQGRVHPINSIIDQITDIFVGLGYTVAAGPEVESDYYNFEALNFLPDHPARDMQDTLYLPNGDLMRTHTSNIQIRYMKDPRAPPAGAGHGAVLSARHRGCHPCGGVSPDGVLRRRQGHHLHRSAGHHPRLY